MSFNVRYVILDSLKMSIVEKQFKDVGLPIIWRREIDALKSDTYV